MKYRIISLVLLVAIFNLISVGCGKTEARSKKIGLVLPTLSNPFFVDMANGAKSEITKHDGYELYVQACEKHSDIERQIQIVENMCAQKLDVICIVPSDSKGIIPSIKKANANKIPVINIDAKIDVATANAQNARIAGFIGSDNFSGGELAGDFIVEKIHGKGKVAILEGISGVEAAAERKRGCMAVLKKVKEIKVVASIPADWEREKGMNVFQDILQTNPDLNAVFACNDEMALGAIRVIKDPRKIVVVGFDATDEARQAVKKGLMDATIAQQPCEMGRQAIENAVKVIEGQPIVFKIETPLKLIKN
jgi:ribose transport system substrate-binding protein